MAQDYTVGQIVKDQKWSGDKGEMRTIELALEGMNSTVKIIAQANYDTPYMADKWPEPGDVIFGTVQGDRFKYEKRPEGQQSMNGGGSTGGDEYARRPDHPDNSARARHSTAVAQAPAYYELFRTEGVLNKAENLDQAKKTLEKLVDWLKGTYPLSEAEKKQHDSEIPF